MFQYLHSRMLSSVSTIGIMTENFPYPGFFLFFYFLLPFSLWLNDCIFKSSKLPTIFLIVAISNLSSIETLTHKIKERLVFSVPTKRAISLAL